MTKKQALIRTLKQTGIGVGLFIELLIASICMASGHFILGIIFFAVLIFTALYLHNIGEIL